MISAHALNLTDIARDVGVSVDTARRWMGVLETTYVAERRTPFWRNNVHASPPLTHVGERWRAIGK